MSGDPALARAYSQARYELHCADQTVVLCIGEDNPTLARALRANGCQQHGFIITPCNPQSKRIDTAENDARLRAMQQRLTQSGWSYVKSLACAEDGTWVESGFCIFDIGEQDAQRLGRQYQQHAIVKTTLDHAPALIWLDEPTEDPNEAPDI